MPETLLSPSNVLLYGRVMEDLAIVQATYGPVVDPDLTEDGRIKDAHGASPLECHPLPPPPPPPRRGDNKFLQRQLLVAEARLARIYGFSYEGHYYDLAKPAIFLVHGPGDDPEAWRPATDLPDARSDRAPSDADRSGIARTGTSFAEDMRVWSYDKDDFSIRLDIETGTFEQILLEAAMTTEKRQYYSGADLRVAGADLRVAGADLRLRRNRGGD
jgi:hypothetical protein